MWSFSAPLVRWLLALTDTSAHNANIVLSSDSSRCFNRNLRWPRLGLLLASVEQLVKDRFVELPRQVRIGVGERRAIGCKLHAQVLHLAFVSGYAAADLTQALGVTQLKEHYGDELIPAVEPARVALGAMLLEVGLKLEARDEQQNSAENSAYPIHGRSAHWLVITVSCWKPEST